jgi:hypothetical protein
MVRILPLILFFPAKFWVVRQALLKLAIGKFACVYFFYDDDVSSPYAVVIFFQHEAVNYFFLPSPFHGPIMTTLPMPGPLVRVEAGTFYL